MKSVRRKAYLDRKNKKSVKGFPFLTIAISFVGLILLLVLVNRSNRLWKNNEKVSLVYKYSAGNIGVTVIDPVLSEITTFEIPEDTEVDVARNYGTFRLKNVWQLGINEKITGSLLAETVAQNFLFPVKYWSENDPGITSNNVGKLIKFIFSPGKTNIPIADRLGISLYSLRLQDSARTEIDLARSRFLSKVTLNDGQPGYEIDGTISERLTVYFSDQKMVDDGVKVNITDATGSPGTAEKMGEIIEVVGGKIAAIDKRATSEDIDCLVSGKNAYAIEKIAGLFSCKKEIDKSAFDLDIRIGKRFAGRF